MKAKPRLLLTLTVLDPNFTFAAILLSNPLSVVIFLGTNYSIWFTSGSHVWNAQITQWHIVLGYTRAVADVFFQLHRRGCSDTSSKHPSISHALLA